MKAVSVMQKMIKTARIISDESKEDEGTPGDRVELYIPEDDEKYYKVGYNGSGTTQRD